MPKLTTILAALFLGAAAFAADNTAPELPAFPVSPLKPDDVKKLVAEDTPEAWAKYAEQTREKALDM
ncbi:MAG: hypothetical protein IJI37_02050, partial [Opitutales bacterium]|nr:hypothetical protein [Opitutales bacterium]